MAVGDAHVFPGFLTPLLTQLSFQGHRLLFSHASVEMRGKYTPDRKFTSTGSQTHNHQVISPTRSPLNTRAGKYTKEQKCHKGVLRLKKLVRQSLLINTTTSAANNNLRLVLPFATLDSFCNVEQGQFAYTEIQILLCTLHFCLITITKAQAMPLNQLKFTYSFVIYLD